MHELPQLNTPPSATTVAAEDDAETLRALSRSPHPYHRHRSQLLEPSDVVVYKAFGVVGRDSGFNAAYFTKESTPASDSGTEADDEHFLKRLPAPKANLHKGLRGKDEPLSGTSTPLLSPAQLEEDGRRIPSNSRDDPHIVRKRFKGETSRRRKELVRRSTELLLLASLGGLVQANPDVKPFIALWRKGIHLFPLQLFWSRLIS